MKTLARLVLITITLCTINFTARPELLIVKKIESSEPNGPAQLAPLDNEDVARSGKIISDILLKCQWPMCIMSQLTQKEQDELLSPNLPYAEERFIENKLRTANNGELDHFRVIFIPTALYELFSIPQALKEEITTSDALQKIIKQKALAFYNYTGRINIESTLSQEVKSNQIREKVYNIYKRVNSLFFSEPNFIFLTINNNLAKYLFDNYPDLKKNLDSFQISEMIKQQYIYI